MMQSDISSNSSRYSKLFSIPNIIQNNPSFSIERFSKQKQKQFMFSSKMSPRRSKQGPRALDKIEVQYMPGRNFKDSIESKSKTALSNSFNNFESSFVNKLNRLYSRTNENNKLNNLRPSFLEPEVVDVQVPTKSYFLTKLKSKTQPCSSESYKFPFLRNPRKNSNHVEAKPSESLSDSITSYQKFDKTFI